MQIHPAYRGHQDPTPQPVCGTRDLALPGQPPCRELATVHIRWQATSRFMATLHCAEHGQQALSLLPWYEHHTAGPACSSPAPTWHPNHCTAT